MERKTFTKKIMQIAVIALFCTNVAVSKAAEPEFVLSYMPPLGQYGSAQGRVVWDGLTSENADQYAVIAMLHAVWEGGGGYYAKPYIAEHQYLNKVDDRGSFSILLTTGGSDEAVDEVIFYFVERSKISDSDVASPATMAGKYLTTRTIFRSEWENPPPQVSPSTRPGFVKAGKEITLSSSEGGLIRYTLDGSDPTNSSTAQTYNNEVFSVPADGPLLVKAAVSISGTFGSVFSFLWLPQEQYNTDLWGLCVSLALNGEPFGIQLTEAVTRERMIPVSELTKWVRTFGTINNGHEYINKLAKEMGMRTMIGLYITSDMSNNDAQIKGLGAILQTGPAPDLICVGNETSLQGVNPATLIACIDKVRDMLIKQGITVPVGSVDIANITWDNALLEKLDFLGVNIYCGTWDNVPESQMLQALKQTYANTLETYQSKLVLIAETGTPYDGGAYSNGGATQTPSIQKAVNYFCGVRDWAKEDLIPVFYFEAYDEPIKSQNNGHPIEQFFGLISGSLEIHPFYKEHLSTHNDKVRNPDTGIKLYPAFFTDVVEITGAEGATLKIFSENGMTMQTHKILNQGTSIHLTSLPAGTYFFHFEKQGVVQTLKAIKK